jgi:hypothetical protein
LPSLSRWRSEAAFAESFAESSFVHSGDGFWTVLPELETAEGVPDFVLVGTSSPTCSKEVLLGLPGQLMLNGNSAVLGLLHHGAPRTREYSLTQLENAGLITRNPQGSYLLSRTFIIPSIQLVSIELKLHNTRRALAQSIRYRSFSTHVLVVMPSAKHTLLESRATEWKAFGVGAATLSPETNHVRFVQRPRRTGPTSTSRYIDTLGRIALQLSSPDALRSGTGSRFPRGASETAIGHD